MRFLRVGAKAFAVGLLIGFAGASGVWLASQTTYPYLRTVVGASLVTAIVIACFATFFAFIDEGLS